MAQLLPELLAQVMAQIFVILVIQDLPKMGTFVMPMYVNVQAVDLPQEPSARHTMVLFVVHVTVVIGLVVIKRVENVSPEHINPIIQIKKVGKPVV